MKGFGPWRNERSPIVVPMMWRSWLRTSSARSTRVVSQLGNCAAAYCNPDCPLFCANAKMKPEALVLVSGSMLMAAESAIGWRQAVVHAVPNRLQRLQIREYCLQMVIAQVSIHYKRHHRA